MIPSKHNKTAWTRTPKLVDLTDFRYQLRRFLSFSETASESLGVPAQQYQLLQVVAAVPAGQESTISYVADRMLLRHNSAVELVDRAEISGLVKRVADENDHRRSIVEITARGAEVLTQLVAKHLTELETNGPELQRTLLRVMEPRQGTNRKSRSR
jgi:DNA-binding MarR family transcriptional regulator